MLSFQNMEKLIFNLLENVYRAKLDLPEFIKKNHIDASQTQLIELIEAIVVVWEGNSKGVNKLNQLGNIIWSHIALANFYSETKESNATKLSISIADKLLRVEEKVDSFTANYLSLIKAKYYLDQDTPNEANNLIKSLLDSKNPLIKTYAIYLLSLAYKQTEDMANFIKTVDDALEQAKMHNMNYLIAMCKLQHSLSRTDNVVFSTDRAREAKNIFNSLGKTLDEKLAKTHLEKLEGMLKQNYYKVGNYLFVSDEMKQVRKQLDEMLYSNDPIMILGPTGSGKTRIADVIHQLSKRNGEFIAINCSSISPNLFESELFGHEKGSFTGAQTKKVGYLEKANGGTLFLDEISEMPIEMQPKLLKVIDEKRFYPVGSTKMVKVDIRFIAATNREIQEIQDGKLLRLDLFHRFTWPISLKGLEARKEEILVLAEEFLKRHSSSNRQKEYVLTQEAKTFLLRKRYEGNIRTLENSIRRAIGKANVAETKYIQAEMLIDPYEKNIMLTKEDDRENKENTDSIDSIISLDLSKQVGLDGLIASTIIRAIEFALKSCGGNSKEAARFLDLNERRLHRYKLHYAIRN
jgi:DNA-binding NtrC family response regulator